MLNQHNSSAKCAGWAAIYRNAMLTAIAVFLALLVMRSVSRHRRRRRSPVLRTSTWSRERPSSGSRTACRNSGKGRHRSANRRHLGIPHFVVRAVSRRHHQPPHHPSQGDILGQIRFRVHGTSLKGSADGNWTRRCRARPQASRSGDQRGWLIFAAFLPDFLLGLFASAGWEDYQVPPDYASKHYLLFTFPFSHGLLADLPGRRLRACAPSF